MFPHRSILTTARLAAISCTLLLLSACSSDTTLVASEPAETAVDRVEQVDPTAADEANDQADVAAPDNSAADTATEASASDSAQAAEPTAEAAASLAVTEDESDGELGSGTITVDGVDYVFNTDFCANDEDGIFNQGTGVTPDGTPFTGGIFALTFQDGYAISADLSIGQDNLYGAPDFTMPFLSGSSVSGNDFDGTVDGARVTGAGQAIDSHNVLLGDGETILISFDGECGDTTVPGADADQADVGSNYCALAQVEADRATEFANNFQMTNDEFEQYLTSGLELAQQIDRPDEIAAELNLVYTALAAADAAASANGYDFIASLQDMADTLATPETISAGLTIESYNERVCGIDGPNQ